MSTIPNFRTYSDNQIIFAANDCFDAIKANPDNPKVPEYFETRMRALRELADRERIRNARYTLHQPTDRLLIPVSQRWRCPVSAPCTETAPFFSPYIRHNILCRDTIRWLYPFLRNRGLNDKPQFWHLPNARRK